MKQLTHLFGVVAALFLLDQSLAQDPRRLELRPPALSPMEAAVGKAVETGLRDVPIHVGGDAAAIRQALIELYEARQYRPAWLDGNGPRDELSALVALLQASHRHGLIPAEYRAGQLEALHDAAAELVDQRQAATLAGLEVLASSAAIAYLRDLSGGRFGPDQLARHANIAIDLDVARADAGKLLAVALEEGVERTFEPLAPNHPQYRRLQKLLAALRERPAMPKVQLDGLVKEGDRNPALVRVRQLLNHKCHQCPTLSITGESAELMDDELVAAIKTFQTESGIREDGIIGPGTVKMLNLGVERQIEWVRTNLDRWRWYSGRLEPPYILVNVPEYRLRYYQSESAQPMEMDIIVGKIANATPMFSDVMEYAVLRPYWRVPESIATKEMLPRIREDIAYFWEEGIEVLHEDQPVHPLSVDWTRVSPHQFDFMFRQLPGPENSLGLIKFMLPNEHAIYLHDTPADQLFKHERRAFSHGCIRLERPFALARELLPPEARVDRRSVAQAREDDVKIDLKTPVPVHIAYFTVVVDDQGHARFLNDIYKIDEASEAALAEAGRAVERLARITHKAALGSEEW